MRKIHFLLSTSLIAYSLYASETIIGHVVRVADGDSKAYAKEEQEAKEARRGLWSESNPIAPWDFRKKKK